MERSRRSVSGQLVALLVVVSFVVGFLAAAFSGTTLRLTPPSQPAGPLVVADDWNRNVTVPAKVNRIISLAPSTTEILFAVGAGNRVVGVSDFTDYPPEARSITLVLTNLTVNYEKIIELHPDLILAADINSRQDVDRLANLFPVLVLAPKDMEGIMKDVGLVGEVTGNTKGAGDVVAGMRASVDAIKAKVAQRTSTPRVFYFLDFGDYSNRLGGGAWTGGRGTFWDALIGLAGGANIAGDINGWKIYNTESILVRGPQVLILGKYVDLNLAQLQNTPGWKDLSAVKSGKVYKIQDDAIFDRPGPRIVQGLEWLAKTIHPELYGSYTSQALEASLELEYLTA